MRSSEPPLGIMVRGSSAGYAKYPIEAAMPAPGRLKALQPRVATASQQIGASRSTPAGIGRELSFESFVAPQQVDERLSRAAGARSQQRVAPSVSSTQLTFPRQASAGRGRRAPPHRAPGGREHKQKVERVLHTAAGTRRPSSALAKMKVGRDEGGQGPSWRAHGNEKQRPWTQQSRSSPVKGPGPNANLSSSASSSSFRSPGLSGNGAPGYPLGGAQDAHLHELSTLQTGAGETGSLGQVRPGSAASMMSMSSEQGHEQLAAVLDQAGPGASEHSAGVRHWGVDEQLDDQITSLIAGQSSQGRLQSRSQSRQGGAADGSGGGQRALTGTAGFKRPPSAGNRQLQSRLHSHKHGERASASPRPSSASSRGSTAIGLVGRSAGSAKPELANGETVPGWVPAAEAAAARDDAEERLELIRSSSAKVRLAVARQTLDELAERDRGYAHGELLALVKAEYESHLESSKTDGARRKEGLVQEATAAADRKIFTLKEDLDRLARDHERLLQELKELKSQNGIILGQYESVVANSQALKDALADAEAAKEQLDNASGYGEVVAAAAEKPQAAAHSSFNLETPLMKQKKSQNMKLQVLVQVLVQELHAELAGAKNREREALAELFELKQAIRHLDGVEETELNPYLRSGADSDGGGGGGELSPERRAAMSEGLKASGLPIATGLGGGGQAQDAFEAELEADFEPGEFDRGGCGEGAPGGRPASALSGEPSPTRGGAGANFDEIMAADLDLEFNPEDFGGQGGGMRMEMPGRPQSRGEAFAADVSGNIGEALSFLSGDSEFLDERDQGDAGGIMGEPEEYDDENASTDEEEVSRIEAAYSIEGGSRPARPTLDQSTGDALALPALRMDLLAEAEAVREAEELERAAREDEDAMGVYDEGEGIYFDEGIGAAPNEGFDAARGVAISEQLEMARVFASHRRGSI